MRPQLQPGMHVLRRRDAHLQVGLDRRRSVLLPDNPEVRAGLDRLTSKKDGPTTDGGLLEALQPVLTAPKPKRCAPVTVLGFGHPAGAILVERVEQLLKGSGHALVRSDAELVVLAGAGEPDRAVVDELTRAGTPYVLLRLIEGDAVVGPFVVPGLTACLRCLDAHATDDDPSWPLLVHQYVTASSRDRTDGVGEPVDPTLAELVCAWAARDAVSFLDGHRPSTWSATIRLDPLLRQLESQAWLRHPDCGCTWG